MSKSLVQYIIEEQRAIPGVSGNFTGLISDIGLLGHFVQIVSFSKIDA
jgi:hypothetical protein